MFNENNFECEKYETFKPQKKQKKITKQRLKNIALYYLKRFESSVENLRSVLQKRVFKYIKENPDFDKFVAYQWIEEILTDLQKLHYLDDDRFAEIKIRSYLKSGKPARYIINKLREKGIKENKVNDLLMEQNYDPFNMALKFVKKKKIGPYRIDDSLKNSMRQKDMATLVRAGFDYDIACKVIEYQITDDDMDDDLL